MYVCLHLTPPPKPEAPDRNFPGGGGKGLSLMQAVYTCMTPYPGLILDFIGLLGPLTL